MHLTKEQVVKIAKLARIKIKDAEIEPLQGELSKILDWVEMLSEVDTKNVEQMTSVSKASLPLREDKISDGDIHELIFKNAPENEYGCFVVPKVVE